MAVNTLTVSAAGTAAGTATVAVTPYRRQVWTVSQVSIEAADAPGGAIATLRLDGRLISPLVAHADAAAGDPPVTLRPGQRLAVEWQNLNAGDRVEATFIYDDGID